MEFIDYYRIFYPKTEEHTFFFKSTWDGLQESSHTRPLSKSEQLQGNETLMKKFFLPQQCETGKQLQGKNQQKP